MKLLAVVLIVVGLWGLFRARTPQPVLAQGVEEQALLVTLSVNSEGDADRVHELEDRLEAAVKRARAGELDGDEFSADTCTIYMYGPSAERLYEAVIKLLKEFRPAKGSYLIKRFGKPGSRQERFELNP